MAANDQIHDSTERLNGSNAEEREAEITPLQRCPHLYIKYTAAKGRSTDFLHPVASEAVCRRRRPFTYNKLFTTPDAEEKAFDLEP